MKTTNLQARPQSQPNQPSERSSKPSDTNEWADFYASQSTKDDGILWVEREKEKIDWKKVFKDIATGLTSLIKHVDYQALKKRTRSITRRIWAQTKLRRTVQVLGVLSVLLLGASFAFSGALSDNESVSVLSETTNGSSDINESNAPEQAAQNDFNSVDVVAIEDTIQGFPVIVSQQELPQEARSNPSQLEEIAKALPNILRFESFTNAAGRVHVGTSHQGNQVAVFSHNEKLVTISSTATLPATVWSEYVETLIQEGSVLDNNDTHSQ